MTLKALENPEVRSKYLTDYLHRRLHLPQRDISEQVLWNLFERYAPTEPTEFIPYVHVSIALNELDIMALSSILRSVQHAQDNEEFSLLQGEPDKDVQSLLQSTTLRETSSKGGFRDNGMGASNTGETTSVATSLAVYDSTNQNNDMPLESFIAASYKFIVDKTYKSMVFSLCSNDSSTMNKWKGSYQNMVC